MLEKEDLGRELVAECRRRLVEESLPRARKCLSLLSEEDVWHRPNDETASVGNLLLHLSGNVRQWIVSGLGAAPDRRLRQKEFDERGPLPKKELLERLEATLEEACRVLDSLDAASLLERRTVQGFEVSGVSILVHVVEHFSYHVGQITYFTKSRKNVDLKYYGKRDLDRTGPQ